MPPVEFRPTRRIPGICAGLLLVSVLLGGCAALESSLQRPEVRLNNVQLLQAGLLEQVYLVSLQVDNPNGFTLPVDGLSYTLRLGGAEFASGSTPNRFSVPARGGSAVDVEVRTNLLETISHLRRIFEDRPEQVDYEMNGSITVDLPLVGAIPFSRTGKIDLSQLQ